MAICQRELKEIILAKMLCGKHFARRLAKEAALN